MLAERAEAKGLTLGLEIAPDMPRHVVGDASRLRQIAVNYIGNAIKFTRDGGVRVRLGLNGERVRFEVSDTGVGVPAERIATLFDPFTQADASTTRVYGGTGLGLAIVRRLADLMNGSVGVDSVEGAGSTFWFEARLPTCCDGPNCGVDVATAAPQPRSGHILVAEDNEANQMLIRLVLAKLGHSCDLASDGVEAVRMAAQGDYRLIILDRRMPSMDGEEAARRIRALGGSLASIPMIGLTADVTEDARASFAAAGVMTVLPKPIVIARLAAAIDAALAIGDARRIA
jgi:CheY-like chemotaxis protein